MERLNSIRNNKPEASALAKHAVEKTHSFDFPNTAYPIFII